jgi:hypothetical protein
LDAHIPDFDMSPMPTWICYIALRLKKRFERVSWPVVLSVLSN